MNIMFNIISKFAHFLCCWRDFLWFCGFVDFGNINIILVLCLISFRNLCTFFAVGGNFWFLEI